MLRQISAFSFSSGSPRGFVPIRLGVEREPGEPEGGQAWDFLTLGVEDAARLGVRIDQDRKGLAA